MPRSTMKEYGAEGAIEVPRLNPEADNILTVCDDGHFLHGKVNLTRYQFSELALVQDGPIDQFPANSDEVKSLEIPSKWIELKSTSGIARKNALLVISIRNHGVEQAGKCWAKDGKLHVIDGTRRVLALRIANQLRAEEGLDPFLMKFEISSRWDEAMAVAKWRLANQQRVDNDFLTRIQGAALDIDRGVSWESAAETWELDERQLRRALKSPSVLEAAEEVKEALATGSIPLSKAIKISKLSGHDAQILTLFAVPEKAPKRKYITPENRAEFKRLLEELPPETPNLARLQALAVEL